MRVVVASSFAPFLRGGATVIVEDLVAALSARGHEVDTVLLPAADDVTSIDDLLAYRLLDLTDAGDLLVSIRAPSHLLRHPRKVVWFIHHLRGAYDLWGTPYQTLPTTSEGVSVRRAIVHADDVGLREARRVFTNSAVVRDRLKRYNRVEATVLYPPLGDPSGYRSEAYDNYVFFPSRITQIKRQHLLVEAMARVTSDVRAVIVGPPDHPQELERLRQTIDALRLHDRIELVPTWVSEEEKQRLFARALACVYIPYDEDSYGYVTLEAFHSRKPVITCTDSGGTLEIVEDGETGLVVEPRAEDVAAAIDRLARTDGLGAELGTRGEKQINRLGITWDNVVEHLLA